ncbi:membrane-spanning 4-domains subfamily A member 15-like [Salarias fasciatus]|uniref:membrane-spanning 4-domains subfamily A member 15-like n=1 Tax=Salarias fasciatus TaxID=181472 RepID=UPI001176B50D|nr:membrane-spanning 4-domains subfamily A member 15-like [Salarias fasciatus]
MVSSTVSYTSGDAVVVTSLLPETPNGQQQPSMDRRHNFGNRESKALGTVQIMIGALTLLSGIFMAFYHSSIGVTTGFFVWGALIYITSGVLTVAAEKYLSRSLIKTSVAFNIIAAVAAAFGAFLYVCEAVIMSWFGSRDYNGGFSAVLAVFQFVELIMSITVAGCASHATCCGCCSCCTEEPQVVVQAVEGLNSIQPPPYFQVASVAPTDPFPEVVPYFKNVGDLGSAEPPPYQP